MYSIDASDEEKRAGIIKEYGAGDPTAIIKKANNVSIKSVKKHPKKRRLVFVRYTTSIFFNSIHVLMSNVASDIGLNYTMVDKNGLMELAKAGIENAIIIFVMHPDHYLLKYYRLFDKRNNIFVIWNFEPLIENIPRYNNRFNITKEILYKQKGDIDYFWFHDNQQFLEIGKENCWFMPFGYHKCLRESLGEKNDCNKTCFIGARSERREWFIKNIGKEIYFLDRHNYISHQQRMEYISTFNVGLEIHAHKDLVGKSISWMRSVVYSALGVGIISDHTYDCVLTEDDFFYCPDPEEAAVVVKKLGDDPVMGQKTAKNALNAIKGQMDATKLMQGFIEKIKY